MFTCYANDYTKAFPTKSFSSLQGAIAYGLDQKVEFSVSKPSGAIAATKTYADSDVVIYG